METEAVDQRQTEAVMWADLIGQLRQAGQSGKRRKKKGERKRMKGASGRIYLRRLDHGDVATLAMDHQAQLRRLAAMKAGAAVYQIPLARDVEPMGHLKQTGSVMQMADGAELLRIRLALPSRRKPKTPLGE